MNKSVKVSDKTKTFWPDNPFYVSFGVMITAGGFIILKNHLLFPILYSFPFFLMAVVVLFMYSQSIVIYENEITGPTAYGKRRMRTTIQKKDCEAFIEKKIFFKQIIVRDKNSSNQILVPKIYFSDATIEKLIDILKIREIS